MNQIQESTSSQFECELQKLISKISQHCYRASWQSGIEYEVWNALQANESTIGAADASLDDLEKAKNLSLKLNGWVVWRDDENSPGCTDDQCGPYFIAMDQWLALVAAHKASTQ